MKKIKQTKTEVISDPSLRSHVIKVTPVSKPAFYIPVVDVRDGEEQRESANRMIKANASSKYMKPSYSVVGPSYNQSMKEDGSK